MSARRGATTPAREATTPLKGRRTATITEHGTVISSIASLTRVSERTLEL